MIDLSGKVAVVTGGTRGIGRAIAETLAGQGATLIVNGRHGGEALDRAVEEIAGTHSVPVVGVAGDIGLPETSAEIARQAFARFKKLDVYVNNAGVLMDSLIGMIPPDSVDQTLDINVKGVIYGTQAAARLMQRGGGGSIINLTSIIGRFGNEGQLVYGASKAAVIGATLSAAKELASRNIRVNAIAPGFIDTDMVRQLPDDKFQQRLASIAMKRIGTPADVARAALFFASDLSSYVTGQVLGVDGGMLV
jgi:3-oxoacyl-[acyl-carrier protein] reductase